MALNLSKNTPKISFSFYFHGEVDRTVNSNRIEPCLVRHTAFIISNESIHPNFHGTTSIITLKSVPDHTGSRVHATLKRKLIFI